MYNSKRVTLEILTGNKLTTETSFGPLDCTIASAVPGNIKALKTCVAIGSKSVACCDVNPRTRRPYPQSSGMLGSIFEYPGIASLTLLPSNRPHLAHCSTTSRSCTYHATAIKNCELILNHHAPTRLHHVPILIDHMRTRIIAMKKLNHITSNRYKNEDALMKYRTADEFEDFDVMFSESKEASKRCCIPCIVEGANCRSNAISEPPANANA